MMPPWQVAKYSPLGAVGTLRSFMNVLREMSFDDVREQADQVPKLLVVASSSDLAAQLARSLTGTDDPAGLATRDLSDTSAARGTYDAILVFDTQRTGAAGWLREQFRGDHGGPPVVTFDTDKIDDERALKQGRANLMSRLPDRAPAFGRHFPAFRPAAIKAVIDETARANAQFAAVSNIPSLIPIVGSLASASADFLVLTKNQLMLLFKIAAIHGSDLHDQWRIMREMVPVVGAGLVWRTVAREAASFIPLAAGTIPKVAIAYAGTLTAGRAADFYYRMGKKPTREHMLSYYQQAAEAVKKLPLSLTGRDRGEDETGTAGETRSQSQSEGSQPAKVETT